MNELMVYGKYAAVCSLVLASVFFVLQKLSKKGGVPTDVGESDQPSNVEKSNKTINYVLLRSTIPEVETKTRVERISSVIFLFCIYGSLGGIASFIPVIGGLIRDLLILLPIVVAYLYIKGDKDVISKLVGACPHCASAVTANNIKSRSCKCPHCKQKIFIRDERFYTGS